MKLENLPPAAPSIKTVSTKRWRTPVIALALSFLTVTCNVAEQRNVRRDLSYFRTSSPGTATVAGPIG